jgi:hypothetical protein
MSASKPNEMDVQAFKQSASYRAKIQAEQAAYIEELRRSMPAPMPRQYRPSAFVLGKLAELGIDGSNMTAERAASVWAEARKEAYLAKKDADAKAAKKAAEDAAFDASWDNFVNGKSKWF